MAGTNWLNVLNCFSSAMHFLQTGAPDSLARLDATPAAYAASQDRVHRSSPEARIGAADRLTHHRRSVPRCWMVQTDAHRRLEGDDVDVDDDDVDVDDDDDEDGADNEDDDDEDRLCGEAGFVLDLSASSALDALIRMANTTMQQLDHSKPATSKAHQNLRMEVGFRDYQ
ncbi:unnamed protein product [Protopolystoma xenopodis]|uniref:Uncharacterized protein n=1 Tax=Protopolystoma xenopodis TaxID=117903 RepID=A0A448XID9_9PLAT|nr:unnamed protein product [Protopolystoma xenopodis]